MADFNNKLRVDFIANTDKFNQKIGRAKGKLNSFARDIGAVGRDITMKFTAPLALAGGVAVKQAAKFETLRIKLNTLTGSAEEGAAAFEKLVEFSAKTPFQLDQLVDVNNMLMGFGLSSNEAFDSLSMLGDISGIVGGDLQGIGIAFGQAAAEGRVMTRDLRQFINNGVPILDILATSMGVARGEIMDMASEGKITFDILNQAFKDATSECCKFHNGMETLSTTISGLFSTLKDNVNIALAELGQEIVDILDLKNGIPKLTQEIKKATTAFKNLDSSTKEAMFNLSSLVAKGGLLAIAIGAFASFWRWIGKVGKSLKSVFGRFNPWVIGLTAIIGIMDSFNIKLRDILKTLGKTQLAPSQIFSPLIQSSIDARNELDELQRTIDKTTQKIIDIPSLAFADPLTFTGTRETQFPTSTPPGDTGGDSGTTLLGDSAMGGGFLGINPFMMGTGFTTLSGVIDKELPKMSNHINGFTMYMNDLTTKITDFKVNADADFSSVSESVKGNIDLMTPFLTGFANSLSGAFTNASGSFESFAMAMLGVIGDLLIQMGMAAMAASELAKTFAIPGVGFAAGLAAFTLGTLIKAIASSVQEKGFKKMASGGIVSGPTTALIGEYPGARSNPEVVAPLSKLKSMIGGGAMQGEFVLRGQDLVVALQRAERNRNRFK